MPNTSEGQAANLPRPAEHSELQRPAEREEEEDHGLISSLARDAARLRRASSAELHLQWTCPVTHSREKFYTVCSDYALLNQAASVYCCPPKVTRNKQEDGAPHGKPKASSDFSGGHIGGGPVGSDGDCDVDELSSGHAKPLLAWEIDTADFNTVFTRKIRTSKLTIIVYFNGCMVLKLVKQLPYQLYTY